MAQKLATIIVMMASGILLAIWFRYACLLILVAKPPRDYARGVAIANQLAFFEVQEALRDTASADLRTLRAAIHRDFCVLNYLLKHTKAARDHEIERGMLRIDYWTMRAWCLVSSRASAFVARRALQEMAMVVAYFASTLGEQLAI
jgi:hypothetical protein